MNPKLILSVLALLSVILLIRIIVFMAVVKSYPQNQTVTFEAHLSSQPKISVRGQQFSLAMPNSQRVTVRISSLLPKLSYGDRVKVQGKIDYFEPEPGKKIAFINEPRFELMKRESRSNLMLKVRERMISFFDSNMGPTESALMLGIVFGIREEMPGSFHDNLQKSGLLHVIAASGMNITMTAGFFIAFFGLFLKRQLALIVSIFGILIYALLAGLEPSIVRATIMGVLVFVAQAMGRQNSAFLGLFAAAFIMLFISPPLIMDIGFQLSFLATVGIIYLKPIFFIKKKLRKLIQKSIIGEDMATTITAQAITLPILLINFGSYSILSVFVNAIVLWTVPILMIIGGVSALSALAFEPLGRLISFLALPFLSYFQYMVNFFGTKSPVIGINQAPSALIAGYYLILFAVILYLKRR